MTDNHMFKISVLVGIWSATACDKATEQDAADNLPLARLLDNGQLESRQVHTRFFTPPPRQEAIAQVTDLVRKGDLRHAIGLAEMETTPRAVWFASGSPDDVEAAVRKTMSEAKHEHRVPILVAYNLPFRDCAQYSAGGATDSAAYQAWIDGFAAGIGSDSADVMLEPDGLGLIPYNATLDGTSEWCKPTLSDGQGNTLPAPGADPETRYAQLNYAVTSIKNRAPHARTYLDGTHSAWLSAGEAAYRLVKAGIGQARGFFLNVSNFQPTPQLVEYGTWVSKCIYYANNAAEGGWRLGHYDYCASQYYPASASDYSTWSLTDQWYTDNVDGAANPPSGPDVLAHFIVDTGRNGKGPLSASAYAVSPYNQPQSVITSLGQGNWCNPPGAGLGLRPTASTGAPLVDAYLWVKAPGESDGTCDSAGGARAWDFSLYNPWAVPVDQQDQFDPLWGMVDPPSGAWFAAQAIDLVDHADPPVSW